MNDNESTQSINLNDPAFLQMLQEADASDDTVPEHTFDAIILRINNASISLDIHAHQTYFLGRFAGNAPDEIDLNPHGGLHKGISRLHAQITISNHRVYITDLGSSNGTYISKKRLQPNQQTRLHNGDTLLLGRLKMLVTMR